MNIDTWILHESELFISKKHSLTPSFISIYVFQRLTFTFIRLALILSTSHLPNFSTSIYFAIISVITAGHYLLFAMLFMQLLCYQCPKNIFLSNDSNQFVAIHDGHGVEIFFNH